MKKSLLEIYALAVCFVTIICFAVSLGIGIYDVLEMSAPKFTLKSHDFERHQTNEAFTIRWKEEKREKYAEEEITNLREESYQVALAKEQRDAIQSLIRVSIIILIDIVLFLIHWKVAKRLRESFNT
jgi:hypothetical protein